ncbi:MAG: hypothetical protein IJB17_05490 [Oscillospiraceae bacterium]|nr:hypothetical protein [Oscillospiraceae bacterium]
MGKKDSTRWSPRLPKVENIKLSGKNKTLRIVLIVILLVVAAVSLSAGLTALLNREPGWQEVSVDSGELHCGGDFVLQYDFGGAGMSATAESKALTAAYSEAAVKAWQLFSSETPENGNLAWLNAHVNEPVTVDPGLYTALELVVRYENRHVFLGAVYSEYERMLLCESDGEAERYDPAQNPELLPYIKEAAAFANDPAAVRLELLGENRVQLSVSEDYLAFADTHEITGFVDFGWMTNAFAADYLADTLSAAGFTRGYLVSYDGFTRNLDLRGQQYGINVFDRQEDSIYIPAVMHYSSPMSIVALRDFPLSERDRWHYYSFASLRIATLMIDPADGMDKSAVHDLLCYSEKTDCGEIVLQIAPVFIADLLDEDALKALAEQQIYSVWPRGTVLCYNQPGLALTMTEDSGIAYTKELIN